MPHRPARRPGPPLQRDRHSSRRQPDDRGPGHRCRVLRHAEAMGPEGNRPHLKVYVTDFEATKVLELAAAADTATELPFTGLDRPEGIAVDTGGNVYLS